MKFLISVIPFVAGTLMAESPFACDLKALTSAERQRHASLTKRMVTAILERRELADGYAFQLTAERLSPIEITEWIVLEQKCCPFFGFELRIMPERGPTWLHLIGRSGVKDFIREEFNFKD